METIVVELAATLKFTFHPDPVAGMDTFPEVATAELIISFTSCVVSACLVIAIQKSVPFEDDCPNVNEEMNKLKTIVIKREPLLFPRIIIKDFKNAIIHTSVLRFFQATRVNPL
jgi:hypothetical protein